MPPVRRTWAQAALNAEFRNSVPSSTAYEVPFSRRGNAYRRLIFATRNSSGARVAGPIPLPTRIERFTVQRSPHCDKKSQETFEQRTHKRLIDILDPTAKTVDELKKLNLPAGVDITIKI